MPRLRRCCVGMVSLGIRAMITLWHWFSGHWCWLRSAPTSSRGFMTQAAGGQCSPSKLPPEVRQTLGLPAGWPEAAVVQRQWPLLV